LVETPDVLPDRGGAYLWWNTASVTARSIKMPADPAPYAARLYSVLHQLDQEGWSWIAVESPPDTHEWAAVLDRLRRASASL
jgi:L-threonylcarbamoyladenylate synthase